MTASAGSSNRIDQAVARFAAVKFARFLGVTIIDVAPEHAVLTLPYRPEHMNAGGVLNGGASASLLSMAGTLAAWTGIDFAVEPHVGCVDLSVHYLSAGGAEAIIAEARVVRRGRDLCFLNVALHSQTGKPICQGLMSYRAPDYAGHTPRWRAQPHLLPAPIPLTPPTEQRLFRGYVHKLGITPLHHRPGDVRLHMPCSVMHVDERGQLHAGALASLVDIAAVAATWSLVPNRQGARGSTIGMQVSYPATTTTAVVADAHVQQRSEELFLSTVHVTAVPSGQLVAMGQVSYRLLEPWAD